MPLPTLPKPLGLIAASTAALCVLGATAALGGDEAGDQGSVQLTVDGTSYEVDLRGDTVGEVLDSAGLEAGEHDLLSPSAGTPVQDGDRIALRRATELQLVVDGQTRTVWVTADDVEGALGEAGLGDAYVAASRSREVTDGLRLDVRTPKQIRIVADGRTRAATTTVVTVRDALVQAGFRLTAADRVVPARTTPLTDGLVIKVARRTTAVERVAFATERRADPTMTRGTTRTLRAGVAGTVRRTYETSTVGTRTVRTLVSSERLTAPRARVLAYGTKAVVRRAYATSSDGLNWAALARCESGGRVGAVSANGMYYGLYQFSLSTWASVGGSGRPSDASASEQTMRAQRLHARSGAGQWPTCGKYL